MNYLIKQHIFRIIAKNPTFHGEALSLIPIITEYITKTLQALIFPVLYKLMGKKLH